MKSNKSIVQEKIDTPNFLNLIIDVKNWIYKESRFKIKLKEKSQMTSSITPLPPISYTTLQHEVTACQKCLLYQTRIQTVFGTGNVNSTIMLIGEAPGYEEDQQGIPFVGNAGQLLNKMLKAIDLDRDDVYICNVLKCRPPQNRNPKEEEIIECSVFLDKQISLVNPKIIVTLGNFATKHILKMDLGISKLRGKTYNLNNRIIIPTYHPSALLHNPALKRPAWHDLKLLKLLIQKQKL